MPARVRPAARTLALTAAGAVVVAGIAVWWLSRLRSIEEDSRRAEAPPATGPDLRSLRTQLRDLQAALERIEREKRGAAGTDQPPPVEPPKDPAEAASAAHLGALVRAYDNATDDVARERILDGFTSAHSLYAERTGDLQFLPFLKQVIHEAKTETQRKYAVIALHGVGKPEVLDLLEELLRDEHPEVKFYAAEALPWVEGPQQDRARKLLAGAIDDAEPEVRRIAALSFGIVVGDPAYVDPMLGRLEKETVPRVLQALVFAVRRLLPADGPRRIRALLSAMDPSRAREIEALLRD